jgi:hypothetical protein
MPGCAYAPDHKGNVGEQSLEYTIFADQDQAVFRRLALHLLCFAVFAYTMSHDRVVVNK